MSASDVDRNKIRVKEGDHTEKFPHRINIESANLNTLADVVCKDHAAPTFVQNIRKDSNFDKTNCTIVDVDNSESDDPKEWFTLEKAVDHFTSAGVEFYIIPSKSHLKEKGGKTGRDRFHILFPHRLIEVGREYARFKTNLHTVCPFLDKQTKDISRFFFGTPSIDPTQIIYRWGAKDIFDYILERVDVPIGETPAAKDAATPPKQAQKHEVTSTPTNTPPEVSDATSDVKSAIERETTGAPTEGSRNSVLSAAAFKLLTRYGDKDGKARAAYDVEVKRCDPPLTQKEVDDIWRYAVKAYHDKITTKPDYIDPKDFKPNNTAQAEAGSGEGALNMVEENIDDNVDWAAKYMVRTRYNLYSEEVKWLSIIEDEGERGLTLLAVIDYRIYTPDYITGKKKTPPMRERVQVVFDLCKTNTDRDYNKYIEKCKESAEHGREGGLKKAENRKKLAVGSDR